MAADKPKLELVRRPGLKPYYPKSRAQTYADIAHGVFPPPIKFSRKCSAWLVYEVEAIAAARIAGKSDDEVRELVQQLVAMRKQAA